MSKSKAVAAKAGRKRRRDGAGFSVPAAAEEIGVSYKTLREAIALKQVHSDPLRRPRARDEKRSRSAQANLRFVKMDSPPRARPRPAPGTAGLRAIPSLQRLPRQRRRWGSDQRSLIYWNDLYIGRAVPVVNGHQRAGTSVMATAPP